MPAIRPVSAEARLTLVEHLGELRTRLFVSIGILIVAFAFTYWQNERVLDVVNGPLDKAQTKTANCKKKVDPINSGECFDQAVAAALGRLDPVVGELSRTAEPITALRAREAVEALRRAKALAPRGDNRKPVTLGVAEPFFQTINVALYAALVITLPLLLYQLYAFLIPAFTRRERQAIVPLLIGVPFLFYAGVAFGYFLALPRAVDFLQNFNADQFDILVQAKDYYKFVLLFLAGTGLVFQVPVLVIGLSRMGIFTPRQMRKQRGMVALAAAIIAAIITPTPDAVTMLLMMVPLIVLFEVSVVAASIMERRSPVGGRPSRWDDADDDADDDDGHHDDGDDDGPPWPDGDGGGAERLDDRDPDPYAGVDGAGTPPEDATATSAAAGGRAGDPAPDGDVRSRGPGDAADAAGTSAAAVHPLGPDGAALDAAPDADGEPGAGGPEGATRGPDPGPDATWHDEADELDAADPYADPPPDAPPAEPDPPR